MNPKEANPVSSFALTGINISIKKTSHYFYKITIRSERQIADAILEKFRRLEEHLVHPYMIVYTLMSIPSQEQNNSPVAVLYSNPFLIKINRTGQLVIEAYTKLANQKIYHRIPSGSFKNVYFEFSNTPSFNFNFCP